MIKAMAVFMKVDEPRTSGEKTYYNARLLIEGASEALRFPVSKEVYEKMSGLRSLQRINAHLEIDARINKGDFSASPQLNLRSFEILPAGA